ncbi:MAG: C25 family cysteine peptidase [bacterium]|nr:C25 family cysteine peptidase [bacterium]
MRKVFLFCFFLFCASYTFANIYRVHIPDYEITNQTSHLNIAPHDFGVTIEPGKPQLPCKLVWVAIPPGSEVVDCKITRESSLLSVPYYPRTSGTLVKEEEFYSKNGLITDDSTDNLNYIFPKKPGQYLRTIKFCNYNLAEVIIYPYTYETNTNKLYCSPNVTIEFSYGSHYMPGVLPVDTTLDSIIEDKIVNYDELQKWYTNKIVSPYDYVIITPEELLSSVKSFAEWKKSIGYKVKIVTEDKKLKYLPKYLLVIGNPVKEIEGVISGRIPYTDSIIVASILEHIIEFELAEEHKNILFVEAITAGTTSGGIKKGLERVNYETKKDLLNLLEDVVSPYWNYSECKSEEIFNGHSVINFLSIGKQWMWDNGDGIPDSKEIKTTNFKIFSHTPFFVFAPFNAKKFLKENGASIVCPESSSVYMYPWQDSLSGGSQSFNYIFLKYLAEINNIGEAFLRAKMWYKLNFPQDTITTGEFKIFGDPSLSFKKFPGTDVGIIKNPIGFLPLDTVFSPTCLVKNFGTKSLMNFEVYCTIDSSENIIYNERMFIDSLGAFEQKVINFPEWIVEGVGVKYEFNFEVFLAYDENLSNDTFSTFSYVRTGDFIVFHSGGSAHGDTTISSILRELNCKGAEINSIDFFPAYSIYPYLSGFKSIFICDTAGLDSLEHLLQPGYNIYIEGNNTFLSKFLDGKIIQEPALPYMSGKGVSFMSSKPLTKEWFVPFNCSAVFKDTTGVITGFYYENGGDGYKIWCNRFRISDINSEFVRVGILDSIMNTFGVKTTNKGKEALELSNIIDFKSQPNPFYKKTYIKFNVRMSETKINIAVYDLSGKLVKTVVDKSFKPGKYELSWDGCNETGISVSNGIYFVKLSASGGEKENLLLKVIMLKN